MKQLKYYYYYHYCSSNLFILLHLLFFLLPLQQQNFFVSSSTSTIYRILCIFIYLPIYRWNGDSFVIAHLFSSSSSLNWVYAVALNILRHRAHRKRHRQCKRVTSSIRSHKHNVSSVFWNVHRNIYMYGIYCGDGHFATLLLLFFFLLLLHVAIIFNSWLLNVMTRPFVQQWRSRERGCPECDENGIRCVICSLWRQRNAQTGCIYSIKWATS